MPACSRLSSSSSQAPTASWTGSGRRRARRRRSLRAPANPGPSRAAATSAAAEHRQGHHPARQAVIGRHRDRRRLGDGVSPGDLAAGHGVGLVWAHGRGGGLDGLGRRRPDADHAVRRRIGHQPPQAGHRDLYPGPGLPVGQLVAARRQRAGVRSWVHSEPGDHASGQAQIAGDQGIEGGELFRGGAVLVDHRIDHHRQRRAAGTVAAHRCGNSGGRRASWPDPLRPGGLRLVPIGRGRR